MAKKLSKWAHRHFSAENCVSSVRPPAVAENGFGRSERDRHPSAHK